MHGVVHVLTQIRRGLFSEGVGERRVLDDAGLLDRKNTSRQAVNVLFLERWPGRSDRLFLVPSKSHCRVHRIAPALQSDPEVARIVGLEHTRQTEGAELIASENYTSDAVMAAQGSILTNKYAEGLPGKRYYGGCEFVDQAENLAIERLCKLFGAEWANVSLTRRLGEQRGHVGLPEARRHHSGFDLARRALDPRFARELQWQVVPSHVLRGGEGNRHHRHGQGGEDRPGREAPNDHLRGVGLRP